MINAASHQIYSGGIGCTCLWPLHDRPTTLPSRSAWWAPAPYLFVYHRDSPANLGLITRSVMATGLTSQASSLTQLSSPIFNPWRSTGDKMAPVGRISVNYFQIAHFFPDIARTTVQASIKGW